MDWCVQEVGLAVGLGVAWHRRGITEAWDGVAVVGVGWCNGGLGR